MGSLSPKREEPVVSVSLSYGSTSAARGMTYMHEAYIAGRRPGLTTPFVCSRWRDIISYCRLSRMTMHGDDFNSVWKSIRWAANVPLEGIMEPIPASQK